MGKLILDDGPDALLNWIAACDRIDVTSDVTTPTDLTNSLAHTSMTPGNGNDYLIEDGDVSGRKITTFEKLNITADGNGISRHVVLSLSGVIRYVTICVAEDIEIGDLISFPSFKHEIADLT